MKSVDIKNGLLLGASAAVAILVIALVFALTREPIRQTEQQMLRQNLSILLAPNSYNNNPALDITYINHPALGSTHPMAIYRARDDGIPTGAVITCVAPEGYNGNIELLVGLSYAGDIIGVRVTRHNETPGLGDAIEARKSDWINSFNSLVVSEIAPEQWNLKKDGGQFDQFTGATITPRAIVSKVYQVATWYQQNRDTVFAQQSVDISSDISSNNSHRSANKIK